MITPSKYGRYLLHFKRKEYVWILEYLGQDKSKTDVAAPSPVSYVPYSNNIYVTELVAVDHISAFTRGANNIGDYQGELKLNDWK